MNIILHPYFQRAERALLAALAKAAPGQLIFVVGLSGAGKTELRRRVMAQYTGACETWGIGRIPAIAIRAAPSDQSHFNSKDFITRWLYELHFPRVDWLDRSTPQQARFEEEVEGYTTLSGYLRKREPERERRMAVERMSRARSLKAVFVDEAGSMTYSTSDKPPGHHMVSFMCLAEEIPVVMVLFGVPRMEALWSGNAEIRRRSHFVVLDRYRERDAEDFGRLLATLSRDLPLSHSTLLTDRMQLIHQGTAGVFGEIESFLRRADERRMLDNRPTIRMHDLEAAFYPEAELGTLYEDVDRFDRLAAPRLRRGAGR